MKYLDKTGLERFYEKIKDKLNRVDQLSEDIADLKALLVDGNEVEY